MKRTPRTNNGPHGFYNKFISFLSYLNFRNYIDHHYNEYLSKSFVISIFISGVLYFKFFRNLSEVYIVNFLQNYAMAFLGLAGSLFAVSLAALSVFIVVVHKEALKQDKKLWNAFLYPFVVNMQIWLVVAALSIFCFFIDTSDFVSTLVSSGGVFLSLFTFLIMAGFLYTLDLTLHVIKTAYHSMHD